VGQQSISVARYNAILGRLLGMAGIQSPANELSPEISAVFAMETNPPEWSYLGGQLLAGCIITVPATVANPSVARIVNPANSGIVAVIEAASVSAAAAFYAQASMGFSGAVDRPGGTNGRVSRDSRWRTGSGNASACTISQGSAAFAGMVLDGANIAANTPYQFIHPPIVLFPDSLLDLGSATVNLAIDVVIRWRERPADGYELAR